MLRLNATNQTIQVLLAANVATNQLPVTSSYNDFLSNTTARTYGPGAPQVTNTNNTTAVDVVSSPAANTTRDIDYLCVYNNDTVPATVTVRFNNNGTTYILCRETLLTGEKLQYTHAGGFVYKQSAQ